MDCEMSHEGWSETESPLQDASERQVVFAAIDSFHQYRKHAHYNTTHRRRQNFYSLPSTQWKLLAAPPISIQDTFNAVDDAIDSNADLADAIFHVNIQSFGLSDRPLKDTPLDWRGTAKANDMSKAHSTVRQFYRDWSAQGFEEEVQPILNVIKDDLPVYLSGSSVPVEAVRPTILLPGAGLGRLLLELCLAGYNTEGNEISYHQLMASYYILNCTQKAEQHRIYPFATTFTNNISRANQLQSFPVPDIHPATAMSTMLSTGHTPGEMNMTAGDFTTSYNKPENSESFDAVVTVFFIDTAPNLFRYIQTIYHCLKAGGVWINIGPLLWHFDDRSATQSKSSETSTSGPKPKTNRSRSQANSGVKAEPEPKSDEEEEDQGIAEPGSFELTNEEVLYLVETQGFQIEKQEMLVDAITSSSSIIPTTPTDRNTNPYPNPYPYPNPSRNATNGFGYIQDPNSLLQNRYRCAHWIARKQ